MIRSIARPDVFFQRRKHCPHNVSHPLSFRKDKLRKKVVDELKACTEVKEQETIDSNISILEGLCHIVDKSECTELLHPLIDSVFPLWMK